MIRVTDGETAMVSAVNAAGNRGLAQHSPAPFMGYVVSGAMLLRYGGILTVNFTMDTAAQEFNVWYRTNSMERELVFSASRLYFRYTAFQFRGAEMINEADAAYLAMTTVAGYIRIRSLYRILSEATYDLVSTLQYLRRIMPTNTTALAPLNHATRRRAYQLCDLGLLLLDGTHIVATRNTFRAWQMIQMGFIDNPRRLAPQWWDGLLNRDTTAANLWR